MTMTRNQSFSIASILSFLVSLLLHVILFSSFFLISKLLLTSQKKFLYTYVEKSVKVDMVAMPEFTISELKNIQQGDNFEEETTIDTSKNIDPVIDKDAFNVEKKKISFKDLLKNLSKKNVKSRKYKKVKRKNGSSLSSGNKKILSKLIFSGNKIQQGNSAYGNSEASKENSIFNKYASGLPDLVKVNWTLPTYLLNKKLKCRIRIFINSNGRLINYQFLEKSGNNEFDNRALLALKKTKEYPIPNKSISQKVSSGEIVMGFPL